ncbi:von willebrand factor type A domain protein, putative (macronuclear) [Tetrahymena thermophila SB210]|uniref:von willebrand factor type A domain protein, putative n=1 Tax=Tetrahymena thermophila (strain SB210) TaxID=312017 RepID=I7M7V6_TETTS|nr:von willebrand factor type A domain protein, putative [Tetrahymena thermophila SB210]EAR96085.2 von willebrand factor type A domain protein, putative [Tetrahymena thermophila SB210]|eukprot:XP_001016330.2 von willebrand factor type A domain protein, putative [Tetrahymena thermophila SB210]
MQQPQQQPINQLTFLFLLKVRKKYDKMNNVISAQIDDIVNKTGIGVLEIINFMKQNPYLKVIRLQKINRLLEFSNNILSTLNLSVEKFDKINPLSNAISNFRDI